MEKIELDNKGEVSIVRTNLMNEKDYTPYCGNYFCKHMGPRTKWDSIRAQFACKCGFVTEFPPEFIDRYKLKWNKN